MAVKGTRRGPRVPKVDLGKDLVEALADWCAQRACAQAKVATEESHRPLPDLEPVKRKWRGFE